MTTPSRARSLSCLLALLTACGARTGLLDEFAASEDANDDEDIYGEFPCNYSRSGDLVRHYLQPSYSPDLSWGDGTLAIVKNELESSASTREDLAICTSRANLGFAECYRFAHDREVRSQGAQVTWDGESFGVCWSDRGVGLLLQRFRPDGAAPLHDRPLVISNQPWTCRELKWTGDRYLALVMTESESRSISFDRDGGSLNDEVFYLAGHSAQTVIDIAADDGAFALAWATTDEIWVVPIQGFPNTEFRLPGSSDIRHLALALRGSLLGVLWTVVEIARYRVFLTVLDLESSEVGEPTLVGSVNGDLDGLDISAVPEGFVVAWSERPASYATQRHVFVPTRVHHDVTVEVREENVIYDEPSPSTTFAGAPSLAYDGLDLILSFTVSEQDAIGPQVLLQRIACHR